METHTSTVIQNESAGTLTFWQRNRLIIKAIFIGILILALLIPTAFIIYLVNERQERKGEVVHEISNKWSAAQTISGPYISVPYFINDNNNPKTPAVKKYLYLLPEQLNINSTIATETRYRSIYKVPVYTADILLQGKFENNKLNKLNIPLQEIRWHEASLCIGLSDFKGISEEIHIKRNDSIYPFEIGLPENDLLLTGVSAAFPLSVNNIMDESSFSIRLKLKGSQKIHFTPLGSTTQVRMQSSWKDPAFDGKFLPDSHRINTNGFSANWNILHFNRSFPQQFTSGSINNLQLSESSFGINFLQPVDAYTQTMRSVKYAILIISLTFFIYFFIEIFQSKSVHPLQYILIGFALVIFYTLLLSISEYTSFPIAYVISAFATISLITWYTKSIFKKWSIAITFSLLLSLLYLFIYVLIQLQDNALLFGSIGLFILLAAVMYFSRKIDWYNTRDYSLNPLV
ncbi:MAG: cell envelope integrity protein CreD [Chitinophagaceae bacterium]|nr:cell envelope integrity protein CreD [Chitinophagaceae bacterium]